MSLLFNPNPYNLELKSRYHISFYLWLVGSVQKHYEVPKYYDEDCS